MNTQQNREDRLWEYIDGACSADEKAFIEKLLESDAEWRAMYRELLELHQLMQGNLELDAPSLRFTQNVMEDIARFQIAPSAQSYINKKIIWGIGAFFGVLILGFLVYGFSQVSWSATGGSFSLPFDINRLDWGKFFNNTYVNIFMMINVVLGLALLDMYLGKRKKRLQKEKDY